MVWPVRGSPGCRYVYNPTWLHRLPVLAVGNSGPPAARWRGPGARASPLLPLGPDSIVEERPQEALEVVREPGQLPGGDQVRGGGGGGSLRLARTGSSPLNSSCFEIFPTIFHSTPSNSVLRELLNPGGCLGTPPAPPPPPAPAGCSPSFWLPRNPQFCDLSEPVIEGPDVFVTLRVTGDVTLDSGSQ